MLTGTFLFNNKTWVIIESRAVGSKGFQVAARPDCDTWEKDYSRLFFFSSNGAIRS